MNLDLYSHASARAVQIWVPVRAFIPHGGAALHLEISIIIEKQCVKHFVRSLSLWKILENMHTNSTGLQESTFTHYYWQCGASSVDLSLFFLEWNILVVENINLYKDTTVASVWIPSHMSCLYSCWQTGADSCRSNCHNDITATHSHTYTHTVYLWPFFRRLHSEMNTWPDLQSDDPPSKHLSVPLPAVSFLQLSSGFCYCGFFSFFLFFLTLTFMGTNDYL